jgi:hypothetical protein
VTAGRGIVLALVALVLGAAVASAAPGASIHVKPNPAYRGELVRVSGTAVGGCATGDQVTLLSEAFSKAHEFAGVPAIFARLHSDGSFSKRTRIPRTRHLGRYSITARCGGGNLGVVAHLRLIAALHCGDYTFHGSDGADVTFGAIHARVLTCGSAKRLLRRVAGTRAGCPRRWRCVYPATGRVAWTRGRKRISFVPTG